MISINKPTERLDLKRINLFQKRLINQHQKRYQFAKKYIKGKNVLDIACGLGYGSYEIAMWGAKKVIGMDIDMHSINSAKKNYKNNNLAFLVGNAESIPLKSNYMDVVISYETIEHLTNPKAFIKEIKRILNKDGILILSTPNKEISYGDNPYHLKEYSLHELTVLLAEFSNLVCYGQRKVNRKQMSFNIPMYHIIERIPMISFIKYLFRFRPWEKISIDRINNFSETNYTNLIIKCRK
jgi:2-polyprenyl-3-methyl-5-hydroxy-6-metoxy-1,4-benzoquinol methylase